MKTTHRILLDEQYDKFTESLAVANSPFYSRLAVNPWFRWPVRGVLFAGVTYFLFRHNWTAAALAGVILATSLRQVAAANRKRKERVRDRITADDTVATYALDDIGLEFASKRSTVNLQWPDVIAAILYPQGVLLKLTETGFMWLPDQSLTEGSPADVRHLVEQHVKDCAPAKP
jgi:hypothetical protein